MALTVNTKSGAKTYQRQGTIAQRLSSRGARTVSAESTRETIGQRIARQQNEQEQSKILLKEQAKQLNESAQRSGTDVRYEVTEGSDGSFTLTKYGSGEKIGDQPVASAAEGGVIFSSGFRGTAESTKNGVTTYRENPKEQKQTLSLKESSENYSKQESIFYTRFKQGLKQGSQPTPGNQVRVTEKNPFTKQGAAEYSGAGAGYVLGVTGVALVAGKGAQAVKAGSKAAYEIPVLGRALKGYSAASAARPFVTGVGEVAALSYGSSKAAEKFYESKPSVTSQLTTKQELSIARQGRYQAEESAGLIRGKIGSRGIGSNVFLSEQEQTAGTQKVLESQYNVKPSESKLIAQGITSRYRNTLGATELFSSVAVAERAGEKGVRYGAPLAFDYLKKKGVTYAGSKGESKFMGVLATQTGKAGFLEGVGESISSQQIQTGRVDVKQVGYSGVIGSGTAALFTRTVQAPNILADIGRGKYSKGRKAVEGAFYVFEPGEKPGDLVQDVVQRGSYVKPRDVNIRSSVFGRSLKTYTPGISVSLGSAKDGSKTGSQSSVGYESAIKSGAPSKSSSGSFVNTGSSSRSGVSSITKSEAKSYLGSKSSTSTKTNTQTSTKTNTAVNVGSNVVTPPFPGFWASPDGGGLGAGGRGGRSGKGKNKYAPSLLAVELGIKAGKGRKKVGGYTGLEVRGI